MEVIRPEIKISPQDEDNCGECKKIHVLGLFARCMVFDITLMGYHDWVSNKFTVSGRPDICKRSII